VRHCPSCGARQVSSSTTTVVSPAAADASAKAFQVLRELGLGEKEVKRALAQDAHAGAGDGVETLVRRCLLLLTERRLRAGQRSEHAPTR
jgi:CO/xanthine dehydrogenase Mo-binding subunit